MTESEKEWYAAREAAEYLGIPLHRLARLRREGRIKNIGSHRDPVYHISELKKVDTRDLRRKEMPDSEGKSGGNNSGTWVSRVQRVAMAG